MIYQASPSTPINTSKADAKHTVMRITKGFVYRVSIRIPPGPRGNAGVCIYRGGHPVWPSTPGEWFTGDDERIEFDDSLFIEDEPLQFDIYTYNNSTSYEHEIFFRVGLVSKQVFLARFLPSVAYEIYEQMLAAKAEEQRQLSEQERREILSTPIFGGGP